VLCCSVLQAGQGVTRIQRRTCSLCMCMCTDADVRIPISRHPMLHFTLSQVGCISCRPLPPGGDDADAALSLLSLSITGAMVCGVRRTHRCLQPLYLCSRCSHCTVLAVAFHFRCYGVSRPLLAPQPTASNASSSCCPLLRCGDHAYAALSLMSLAISGAMVRAVLP
jgi:hypothetical protein